MAPLLRWLANSLDGSDALIFESPWLTNAVFAYNTKSKFHILPNSKKKKKKMSSSSSSSFLNPFNIITNHQLGEKMQFFSFIYFCW